MATPDVSRTSRPSEPGSNNPLEQLRQLVALRDAKDGPGVKPDQVLSTLADAVLRIDTRLKALESHKATPPRKE